MNTKIYRCEGKEMPPVGEGVRGKKRSLPVAVVRARRLYLEQIGLIDWFFPLLREEPELNLRLSHGTWLHEKTQWLPCPMH